MVEQAGSNQPTVFPLKWRANGTAETVFKIPEKAKLGTYEVYLAAPSDPAQSGSGPRIDSGSFRVEEFRVPLMKAVIQGPREPLVNAREMEVDLAVSLSFRRRGRPSAGKDPHGNPTQIDSFPGL